MAEDRLREVVEPGEALRFETALRTGGRLGVTDERVVLARGDAVESVPLENVAEVTIRALDWFLVVLSGALAALGLYGVLVAGGPLVGGAFLAVAGVNLYLTYRKRGQLQLHLHAGGNPITVYVPDTEPVRDALQRAIERAQSGSED